MKPSSNRPPLFIVSREEAGMKLLRFLERRLALPPTCAEAARGAPYSRTRLKVHEESGREMRLGEPAAPAAESGADKPKMPAAVTTFSAGQLHKWIRTGQVRVNGKRAKPFALLEEGDDVRVPPFVFAQTTVTGEGIPLTSANILCSDKSGHVFFGDPPALGNDLPLIACFEDMLVLNKPGGLSVQPGSGRSDSVVARLRAAYAGRTYIPAPAHRIDRHTSGLLLVGLTHRRQQSLHALFAAGDIDKEYLAWIYGLWDHQEALLLTDNLRRRTIENAVQPEVSDNGAHAGEARCIVRLVRQLTGEGVQQAGVRAIAHAAGQRRGGHPLGASLLRVRLLTGRTHQIRMQLASRGYPIIGDGRYGGPSYSAMLLHAWRLRVPGLPEFSVQPPWGEIFAVTKRKG